MEASEQNLSTADLAAERTTTDGEAEPAAAEAGRETTLEPLLAGDQVGDFQDRWQQIQTQFVDEPRRSVEQADGLVAELMQRLAQTFSEERSNLESQWDRGDDVSTEDLRVALQRYRSFFERLLAT
jgi:pullulanase/glycogen debranching enzyme